MNEFERKLAAQAFREPPADLRRAVLSAAETSRTERWTWRQWLWPSPLAWGALAAVWLIFAAEDALDTPPPTASGVAAFPREGDAPTFLLTAHRSHELRLLIDSAN